MTGKDEEGNPTPKFSDYPSDFFDFIIIDECHRGGASDESTWRGILEYFSPAVQLGLTATPKRANNADTYAYFGEPVYTYALKDGINDRFLTPFKVRQIETNLDEYIYSPDDELLEGEIDEAQSVLHVDLPATHPRGYGHTAKLGCYRKLLGHPHHEFLQKASNLANPECEYFWPSPLFPEAA